MPHAPFLFPREQLTKEIAYSVPEGRRLALQGRTGSGRFSAIAAALPSWQIIEWDLRFCSREEHLDRLAPPSFVAALEKMERKAKRRRTVLVVRNLDGVLGSGQEHQIMARLRSELQGCHALRILYTVTDLKFVGQYIGHPLSPFFKQAVLLHVPDLQSAEIQAWAQHHGWDLDEICLRACRETAGLRAGDIATLFRALDTQAAGRTPTLEDVRAAAAAVILSRAVHYSDMSRNHLTPLQRLVLHAIALSGPADSSKRFAQISDIPPTSLSSTLNHLAKQGWLLKGNNGYAFADPFLGGYFAAGN